MSVMPPPRPLAPAPGPGAQPPTSGRTATLAMALTLTPGLTGHVTPVCGSTLDRFGKFESRIWHCLKGLLNHVSGICLRHVVVVL